MYVQTSSTLTPNEVIKDLFTYLYDEFTEEEISHFFKLTPYKCDLIRKRGAMDFDSFGRVKDKCGFSYANLYHRGVDHECVKAKLTNSSFYAPKRYLDGAYSSKRTSHSILTNTHADLIEDSLNFLQIDQENLFSDEVMSQKISTLMNSDLLQYLAECHLFSNWDIYRLGQQSGYYNLKLPFGSSFKNLSVKESYAGVVEEIIRHFETSFEYKIFSLTDELAVIRKYHTERMQEETKNKLYSNKYLCKYIQGSLSAISLYSTGKFARATQEKCVFNGDGYSEFHIHLEDLGDL